MDIYDYLKMDHEKIAHLFSLFEDAKLAKRQQEIVALITQELFVHAHAEQETFYKKLAQYPRTKELVSHGKKEHKDIEEQIYLVSGSVSTGKKWENVVLKLKEIVEHHVNEEEGEIFKQAKVVISEKEALILKEKMHYLKGKFLLSLYNSQKEKKPLKKVSTKKAKERHLKGTSTSGQQIHK